MQFHLFRKTFRYLGTTHFINVSHCLKYSRCFTYGTQCFVAVCYYGLWVVQLLLLLIYLANQDYGLFKKHLQANSENNQVIEMQTIHIE